MRLLVWNLLLCLLTLVNPESKWFLIAAADEKVGKPKRTPQARILGGRRVKELSEAPWQVLLIVTRMWPPTEPKPVIKKSWCGGSLVSTRHVVTASHCIFDKYYEKTHHPPLSNLEVYIGHLQIRSGTCWQVRKVQLHPGYEYVTYLNDIAVLELQQDVYMPGVRPICLPTTPLSSHLDQTATIAGFGYTDDSKALAERLNILSRLKIYDQCPAISDTMQIQAGMFCAGGEENKDACQGDSGGPLWVDGEQGCPSGGTLLGVTSWGVGCGEDRIPGVYTDVYTMLSQKNSWLCHALNISSEDCPSQKNADNKENSEEQGFRL